MKDYGKTRSAVKPDEVVVDEYSVWVHTDIQEYTEQDSEGLHGYEFNMIQYEKDEYILMMAQKNSALEEQMTATEMALCEVYELLG